MATYSESAQRELDQASGERMDRAIAYAKRRRVETGKAYIVSGQGHAMLDHPVNRKGVDLLGGVVFRS